jgi:dihydroorotate dehydrogenase
MFSNLRSLIFKLDPETAHNLAIKSLKFNFVPNIIDENKDDPLFKTKIFNKDIENPIGMAAGFDKNAEVYNSLYKLGFGFVEVGTITPLKQYGNPKPRVFRLVEDEALINRLGFNNLGAKNVADRIRSNKSIGLLGINIGPNKDTDDRLRDYVVCLKTFHELADYITINISSPNTQDLRNFHEHTKLNKLLETIDKEKKILGSKIPIAVKISPDIDDQEINKISEVLLNNNIELIIISNTSDSNRQGLENIQRHQKGGLSGKPIEEKSTKLISKFYKILNGRIKIIGVGGVNSGKSAYEKFLAGANYIQLYTGMVFRGPNVVNMIKKELRELLLKDGVKNFTEIIGKKRIT